MVKRVIDMSDYEEPTWEEYTGEDPPPNKWFTAVATKARYDEESDAVVFIVEIQEGDYKGWGRAWYGSLSGNTKWKGQTISRALQGGLTKNIEVDWDNEKAVAAFLKKCKPIRIKTEEYNDKIRIGRVTPFMEVAGKPGTAAPAKASPPPAEYGPTDDGEPQDYTEDELEEMTIDDLVEVLTDEFDVPEDDLPQEPAKPRRDPDGSKFAALEKAYKDELIDMILDEQNPATAPADGDGEPEGDGDFEDGFDDGDVEPEPEPEPEPAKPARRSRATKAAAPAAAPAPAKATATRRRRG